MKDTSAFDDPSLPPDACQRIGMICKEFATAMNNGVAKTLDDFHEEIARFGAPLFEGLLNIELRARVAKGQFPQRDD